MAASWPDLARHLRHQGPVIAGLGRVAASALAQRLPPPLRPAPSPPPALPGPRFEAVVPPRDPRLVADYLRWAGGDPGAWRGRVPPHLFPQWGFGLLPQTLAGLPYPLARGLNGGCALTVHQDLPVTSPLHLTAWLEAVDDDGRRAILTQRLETALPDGTLALEAELQVFIPLGERGASGGARKARALVPLAAREVAAHRHAADDGLRFALLTGDVNPVHWARPYGQAAGFGGTILHGFGTLARALEGLTRTLWAGDTRRLRGFRVRFTRPVRLPGRTRTYALPGAEGGGLWVGNAPGGPAALEGQYFTAPPAPGSARASTGASPGLEPQP